MFIFFSKTKTAFLQLQHVAVSAGGAEADAALQTVLSERPLIMAVLSAFGSDGLELAAPDNCVVEGRVLQGYYFHSLFFRQLRDNILFSTCSFPLLPFQHCACG